MHSLFKSSSGLTLNAARTRLHHRSTTPTFLPLVANKEALDNGNHATSLKALNIVVCSCCDLREGGVMPWHGSSRERMVGHHWKWPDCCWRQSDIDV